MSVTAVARRIGTLVPYGARDLDDNVVSGGLGKRPETVAGENKDDRMSHSGDDNDRMSHLREKALVPGQKDYLLLSQMLSQDEHRAVVLEVDTCHCGKVSRCAFDSG